MHQAAPPKVPERPPPGMSPSPQAGVSPGSQAGVYPDLRLRGLRAANLQRPSSLKSPTFPNQISYLMIRIPISS